MLPTFTHTCQAKAGGFAWQLSRLRTGWLAEGTELYHCCLVHQVALPEWQHLIPQRVPSSKTTTPTMTNPEPCASNPQTTPHKHFWLASTGESQDSSRPLRETAAWSKTSTPTLNTIIYKCCRAFASRSEDTAGSSIDTKIEGYTQSHSIQQEQLEIQTTCTQLSPTPMKQKSCANTLSAHTSVELTVCGLLAQGSGFVMVESLGALLAWHGWKCPQRNAPLASHMAHNIKLSSDPNNIPPKASNLK